jgi:hypothetical protein
MTDPRAYVAPLLAAAGIACLVAAWLCGKPARGAEQPPARLWQVVMADGTAWRTPRGHIATASSETACGLALADAARVVPSGTRLQCRKVKQ